MIAVLITWVIIFFFLFSFGDILLTVYNKYCKRDETYSYTDKAILGLSFVTILLSVWSLWLPSNHIFLTLGLLIVFIYWIFNREKRKKILLSIKERLKQLSHIEKGIILIFFILILIGNLWIPGIFDSLYYHHQNIRWNEEFAVVPGLGNLEDRYSFNSNYLLLSAIFTFRPVFGESIYTLNSLFFVLLWGWILYEIFTSKYEIKRTLIFISFSLFYLISLIFIYDTSTDLLPNLIVFYMIARVIIKPEFVKQNHLLFFIAPIFLLTCKLSVFPFCIFTLYLFIILIKKKRYKEISFLILTGMLILIPWLVRNVIISGYLVYPMHEIDLFSFDWKVPREIAIKAKDYILFVGNEFFTFITTTPFRKYRDPIWVNLLSLMIYGLCILSVVVIIYKLVLKRKNIPLSYFLSALILVLCLVIWYINGPDMRFIPGISTIFLSLTGGFILFGKKKIQTKYFTYAAFALLLASSYIWTARELHRGYNVVEETKTVVPSPFYRILAKPYSQKWLTLHSDFEKDVELYTLNDGISIYICHMQVTYDILPAVVYEVRGKFIDHTCIEARGTSLQEGFRTKNECE